MQVVERGESDEAYTPDDPREYMPTVLLEFIANGEMGKAVAVSKGLAILRFGAKLVKVPIGQERDAEEEEGDGGSSGRGCNFDLGYAATCHKMQGSESPCVVVMIDPAGSGICSREWIYTALSRASKVCLLIGQKAVFDRQRIRQATITRKTFLAELVREVLK
jgi:ATP-dependent exoDNAse (exonuclease V) alpha subunit